MSKVSVACPNCSAPLTVPTDVLGRKIKCPKCLEVVRLPAQGELPGATATVKPNPAPVAGSKTTPTTASPSPTSPTPTNPSPVPTNPIPSPASPASSNPSPVPASPAPVSPAPVSPAAPIMAKPILPMATVVTPGTLPVISKTPAKTVPTPTVVPTDSAAPAASPTTKEAPPNFSGLDSKVAADKPRIKLKRKQANPWPMILLAVGALVVLGLIVTLLILFLPKDFVGGGPSVPEIQFVNDSQTEVGKTVQIPIAVTYPSSFSAADKERWTFQVSPENPPGTAWDAATGFLTWSPGVKDAGKSHALAMIIQNSVTRETNRATFQVHVPALSPGIMSAVAQLNQNQVVFTASIPQTSEAMKHQETVPNVVEFQIGNDRVDVYDYSSVEIATAKLAELDDTKLEELGLTAAMTPPLRFIQRDTAIMIASTAAIEASPEIKNWFDPPPPPTP